MSEPLVVVGNGMAATRLVEELTTRAQGKYAIAVVGDEPSLAYNRVLLSSVLAREAAAEDVELKPARWWRDRGVTLVYGRRAVEIDTRQRFVRLRGGAKLGYAKLVIATGSEAVRLPLPGADLPGVVTFRDKADVATLLERARPGARAVVIGGGLLGLEAAYGLMKAGMHVSLVHLMDRLMERQLDPRAGELLKQAIEARGIEVVLNAESEAIQGRRKVAGLRLKDGRNIAADLVVMAVGIRPCVQLARGAGLDVGRGIVVGDDLATSAPGVYALGECAEHRGVCYGLVEPSYEQARVLASNLAGEDARYTGSLLSTNLKVSGVSVFSAGEFLGGENMEPVVLSDPGRKTYRKLVIGDGCLKGAVLIGDTSDALWYLDLIRSGRPVSALRNDLVFGRAFAGPEAQAA
ncbi:FAD-dependent pyridine nucleotide-disulfide oxidoreductase [Hyphomicrobium nitrativorans NL23]|uniref:FAD-dependent pyridine nucleotide-disulfide oxidoreductase n=1 Tax=Hyphomicrobium nitrativorans NL23 TaxID=1029756 RepID=V5SA97_9HYPH|nr:FAD-dependent oxidoreductase [Hyphomicrobium nitrativorans]AHB47347.1 FAD-dependent pyridine nucleotide-disulfide oxidoreductase [Hyphomicrobium nitrativorans NL23]